MARTGRVLEVIPAREAREQLPAALRHFRQEGADAAPVVFGAHRRPEGVMMSYQAYSRLLDSMDDVAIAVEVLEREKTPRDQWLSEDDLLQSVGVSRSEFEAL